MIEIVLKHSVVFKTAQWNIGRPITIKICLTISLNFEREIQFDLGKESGSMYD